MSLTVVAHPSVSDKAAMLEVLDALREQVEEGELIAFTAVGISDQDECYVFQAAGRHITVLRQIGAVSHLLHCLHAGEV